MMREFPEQTRRRAAGRSLWVWALAILALAWAALGARPLPLPLEEYERSIMGRDPGECLLHGLPCGEALSTRMPLEKLMPALARHLPEGPRNLAVWVFWAALLSLAFSLGALLHSPLAGAMTALAASSMLEPGLEYAQAYPLFVLLAANALVWSSGAPGFRRGLVLGGALGLSLLERSALRLFPPVAAAWALWAGDAPAPARRAFAAAVLIVPFALLLPWAAMNRLTLGRAVFFEDGRIAGLAMTAAAGVVATTEGDHLSLADLRGTSPAAWAAGRILGHPLSYLEGFGRRLCFALSPHPVLFLLAAAAVLLLRRRRGFALVGLLAAYLLLAHCAISVRPRYFTAVWPLLAALASSLLAEAALPCESPSGERAITFIAGVVYAGCLALGLYALGRVAAYPFLAPGFDAERSLARSPGSACLWWERGRRKIESRDFQAAAQDLAKAQALDPRRDRARDLAWAVFLSGGRARDCVAALDVADPGADEPLLAALLALREGDEKAALAAYSLAERIWNSRSDLALGSTAGDREFQLRLTLTGRELGHRLAFLLEPLPVREQIALLERGKGGAPWKSLLADAQWWLDLAERASGDPRRRLEAAAQAGRWPLSAEGAARLAAVCRAAAGDGSLPILRSLAAKRPADPEVLLSLAAQALEHGSREEARRWALKAAPLAATRSQLSRAFLILQALGEKTPAAETLRRLAQGEPGGVPEGLAIADWALRSGERDAACAVLSKTRRLILEAPAERSARDALSAARLATRAPCREEAVLLLERAAQADLGPGQVRETASLRQALGQGDLAARDLRRLTRLAPDDAEAWLALAAMAADAGNRDEAKALLGRSASLRHSPRNLGEAAQLHARLGDRERARELWERQAREEPGSASPLLSLAGLAVESGQRLEALDLIARSCSAPWSAEHRRFAARLYEGLGEPARAAKALNEGCGPKSLGPGILLARAELAAGQGRRQEAMDLLERALEPLPASDDGLRAALLYQRLDEPRRARELLDRLLAWRPDDAVLLSNRAVVRSILHDKEGAMADLRKAIASDPGLLQSYQSLGALLTFAGRRAEALKVYDRALSRSSRGQESVRAAIAEARAGLLKP